jgi:hypothetical protein
MLYLVENRNAVVFLCHRYWIVEAQNAKDAINKVYLKVNLLDENSSFAERRKASEESGITKYILKATSVGKIFKEKWDGDDGIYEIC